MQAFPNACKWTHTKKEKELESVIFIHSPLVFIRPEGVPLKKKKKVHIHGLERDRRRDRGEDREKRQTKTAGKSFPETSRSSFSIHCSVPTSFILLHVSLLSLIVTLCQCAIYNDWHRVSSTENMFNTRYR